MCVEWTITPWIINGWSDWRSAQACWWKQVGTDSEAHFTAPARHCCVLLIAGCSSFSPAAAHFHFHVAQPQSCTLSIPPPFLSISLSLSFFLSHSYFPILLSHSTPSLNSLLYFSLLLEWATEEKELLCWKYKNKLLTINWDTFCFTNDQDWTCCCDTDPHKKK